MMILSKRLIGIIAGSVLLLLVPLIAMQFTNEVSWTLMDFMAAGTLLLFAGLASDLVIQKVHRKDLRIGIIVAIVAGLILIWAELAVGILGTPFAGS